jgi:hypothetical protein
VTLFHKAGSPASVRVANILKAASASAASGATLDQASDHTAQTQSNREQFELNITEDPPTVDQVKTILEYVGKGGISSIIKGATDEKNALKKFHENPDTLLRPVVRSPETLDLYSQWQHTDTGPCRLWIGIMERQLREITSRRF